MSKEKPKKTHDWLARVIENNKQVEDVLKAKLEQEQGKPVEVKTT